MNRAMMIQRIFASIMGVATVTIGILKFLSIVNIPTLDALIHIITGIIFIAGAWMQKGKHVRMTNLYLGAFYILFGIIGNFNWPHIIAGIISVVISLAFRTSKAI